MNVNEAVEKIIIIQKAAVSYFPDSIIYKTAIAEILQELLDTGGVGKEYMEVEK